MIIGVGIDIIEIDRIKRAADRRTAFSQRILTQKELAVCQEKPDFYAALAVRFAAKEAVLKALGTGLRGCSWHEIEITSAPSGQPGVELSGQAREIAKQLGVAEIKISLSHSRGNAVAFCIITGGGNLT